MESYEDARGRHDDLAVLAELAHEESDEDAETEVRDGIRELETRLAALEIKSLFRDEADRRSAILTIHPGAGGIDSQQRG